MVYAYTTGVILYWNSDHHLSINRSHNTWFDVGGGACVVAGYSGTDMGDAHVVGVPHEGVGDMTSLGSSPEGLYNRGVLETGFRVAAREGEKPEVKTHRTISVRV